MSTNYKGGNYSTLKLEGDEITPNIKGESAFFHNSFLLVKLCVFSLNNVLKKKNCQPKKTMCKTMNFGSTNWLKKNKG